VDQPNRRHAAAWWLEEEGGRAHSDLKVSPLTSKSNSNYDTGHIPKLVAPNMQDVVSLMLGDIDFDPDALRAKYLEERDSRLRDDSIDQYIEVTGDFSS
jgi:hypothetical protein